MLPVTILLRIPALLSIVTTSTSATSWDTTPKSDNSSTLIERLTQPVNRVVGENFDNDQGKDFKRNITLRTSFEEKQITHNLMANNNKQYHDYFNPNFHPQNTFKCPPCVCKNITSNSVSVFCTDNSITSIPQNWPVEIDEIHIEASDDSFEDLDLRAFLMYTSLTNVSIGTWTLVKVYSSSSFNSSSSMIDLDLEYNMISTVEDNCFSVFPNLLKLSLMKNQLENLTKEMFTGLRNLRHLSVAWNKIKFIANDTFDDMGNLVILDISNNDIIYTDYDLLPVRMFIPLKNLEELYIDDISGSSKCATYPNKALQVLTNLKLLRIDDRDKWGLGPEIKSLVHLTHLIIDCNIFGNSTNESFFDNVPFITILEFYYCIKPIPPKLVANLTNLVNLTYQSPHLENSDLCLILSELKYFLNCPLKYLTLSKSNDQYNGCKELNAQQADNIKSFNLIELDLSCNFLVYVSPDFIAMLPKTLKKIDLSGNLLSFNFIYSFVKLPDELIEININNQYLFCYDDQNYKNKSKQIKSKSKLQSKNSESAISKKPSVSFEDRTAEKIKISKDMFQSKLQILRADYFAYFGMAFEQNVPSESYFTLKIFSLAGCDFYLWPFINFLTSIEMADFSDNNGNYFDNYFFPENNSLKYFSMANNFLGNSLERGVVDYFFANANKLIALDISRNFITVIPNDYFYDLIQLQVLDVSENKFQMINISFLYMAELRFLDFSKNSITSISKQSRDDLDLIATHHRVYLDLTANPLPCTCDGLDLLKWMAFSNVYLLNQDFLVCRNEFNEELEIGNIVQRVETLQRQCTSKTVIILTCVFSIIVFVILLITSLMYRYRWKLRYLRSILLVKLFGARPAAYNMIGYRFDAYILYTDDTREFVLRDCVRELEKKRGHRLCIEDRDFLPGIYNVSNIVSGVQNSTKTVAMVTPEFYEGEYSEYSVKMALMEQIFMRRSVLFLCVCEPTDVKDLLHDLLTAMKQNNYIEYPPSNDVTDEIIEEFWNQFSRAIGRNERENF